MGTSRCQSNSVTWLRFCQSTYQSINQSIADANIEVFRSGNDDLTAQSFPGEGYLCDDQPTNKDAQQGLSLSFNAAGSRIANLNSHNRTTISKRALSFSNQPSPTNLYLIGGILKSNSIRFLVRYPRLQKRHCPRGPQWRWRLVLYTIIPSVTYMRMSCTTPFSLSVSSSFK